MRLPSLSAGFCLLLFSCHYPTSRDQTATKQSDSTPAALQPASSGMSFISKRVETNLVDQLYQNIVAKDTTLQALEKQIGSLPDKAKDSLADYTDYDEKNQSYYVYADRYAGDIRDSVLRQKLKTILLEDSADYGKTKAPWRDLLDQVKMQQTRLEDLHIALKLYKTLPLIRQYRRQHLPDMRPMQSVLQDYKKTADKVAAACGEKN